MKPLLSIVIPIYNTEAYLKKCIESAIHQTMENIEIILVDDGATDASPQICDEYARRDHRIKVIHKENGGVCDARNVGTRNVKADYFTFLESDDWLPEDACEKLYAEAVKHQADFVLGAYYKVLADGIKVKHPLREKEIYFDREAIRNQLLGMILGLTGERLKRPEDVDSFLTDTAKLYKTQIVREHGLEWISRKEIYSDCLDFLLRYAACCQSAVYFDSPLYYYRRTNEDSQTAAYRPHTVELWLIQFEALKQFIEKNNMPNLWAAFYSRVCFSIIPIGGNAYRMHNGRLAMQEIRRALRQPIYQEAFAQFRISSLPLHFRPLFWFAKHRLYRPFYWMTVIMRRMMNRQRGLRKKSEKR